MDYAKYSKNSPISNMLSGVLNAILERNEEYMQFRSKFDELFSSPGSEVRVRLDELSGKVKLQLEKQFPDCTDVTFEVTAPVFDDLLKSFDTQIDDGICTDAREKGDGMQRALMLAILQTYCAHRREQEEEAGKIFAFLIDEAELHLHPSAQRKLKDALLAIARAGDQVFINTHSSVLVADEDDLQLLFRVEKIDRQTTVAPIGSAGKPSVIYDLLGGSPADLLLPRNFVIVEGASEVEFLNRVIERHYGPRPRLHVIPANGDMTAARRSFALVDRAYRHFHESIYTNRLMILIDHQQQREAVDNFKAAYPKLVESGQFCELAKDSMEESYPAPWQRTAQQVQGMSGQQKIVLARQVGEGISQQQFEADMPEFFATLTRAWELAF